MNSILLLSAFVSAQTTNTTNTTTPAADATGNSGYQGTPMEQCIVACPTTGPQGGTACQAGCQKQAGTPAESIKVNGCINSCNMNNSTTNQDKVNCITACGTSGSSTTGGSGNSPTKSGSNKSMSSGMSGSSNSSSVSNVFSLGVVSLAALLL